MVEVRKYHLASTELIPNSPLPLLHYPGFFSSSSGSSSSTESASNNTSNPAGGTNKAEVCDPARIHDIFAQNSWRTQWIFRYASTQRSHYHSRTHECMVVLSGSATIRFGVADTEPPRPSSPSQHERKEQQGKPTTKDPVGNETHEPGGIELLANQGDVFILPAGVAHKTFNTQPPAPFALLTPGDGHHIVSSSSPSSSNNDDDTTTTNNDNRDDEIHQALTEIHLDGFTMIGAYPLISPSPTSPGANEAKVGQWDFAIGGEFPPTQYDQVWNVPKPEFDPVLGNHPAGTCGTW